MKTSEKLFKGYGMGFSAFITVKYPIVKIENKTMVLDANMMMLPGCEGGE